MNHYGQQTDLILAKKGPVSLQEQEPVIISPYYVYEYVSGVLSVLITVKQYRSLDYFFILF